MAVVSPLARQWQPAVTLGSVTFLDSEHPAKLPYGLEQREAVHELIGGGRTVHDLGSQPEQITFEGTFWDAQAKDKVAAIKAMEKAGTAVPFAWYDQSFSVHIAKFVPTALNAWRIEYAITLTVIDGGSLNASQASSVDSQTQTLYTQAQTLSSAQTTPPGVAALDPSVSSDIALLGTQLNNAGSLAQAPSSTISQITGTIGTIQSSIATYSAALNTALSAYSGLIPPALQQAISAINELSDVLTLISLNAQIGQAAKTIQVGGGTTLFHVASMVYGDATLAPTLKAANGLSSMTIPSGIITTISIPPARANPLA